MLPSVLFALRISKHSSTGMSPYRVLYQRDPVLLFQFMGWLNNGGLESVSDCLNLPESNDPVSDFVEKLEQMHQNVFNQTSKNIKKAQKHQAKCYNARNSGTPFEVGEKVLKRNMRDASRKAKMRNKYMGPYKITGISSNSQYYLKDKYSHNLKRPVPANQLVCYYGVGGFCKAKQDVDVENSENSSDGIGGSSSNCDCMLNDDDNVSESQSIHDDIGAAVSDNESIPDIVVGIEESDSNILKENMDISDTESIQESCTDSKTSFNNCQRSRVHKTKCSNSGHKEENLLPSQITIMQSNDTPFSSYESLLDLCVDDCKVHNPWGNMNVNDIPLDIDTDTDSSTDNEPYIVQVQKAVDVVFSPLSNIECLNAAKKFHIKLRPSDHTIRFKGIGLVFKHRHVVTIAAKPNGACLFNSMSLLLCGTDVYSQIIRHIICNCISKPQNYSKLQQHIPPEYSSRKDYVEKKIMHNSFVWGTNLEVYVFCLIIGHDVYVYSQHKNWNRFSVNLKQSDPKTSTAFYLNNSSGNHFDPVLTSLKW